MAADLVDVNRNAATLLYRELRETIAEQVADESPLGGEVEIDELYFVGHRKGGRSHARRGRRDRR